MIALFIILYVLIAVSVGYGYLIFEYKKNYKDKYSFSELLKLRRFEDEVTGAIVFGIFFPIALAVCIIWIIGHLIVKLIDKIV